MATKEDLMQSLEKLGIADRLDEVLNKTNKFGPTTKFDEQGNLIWLDLSQMGLETLSSDSFAGLGSVTELKLFKNNLSELPDDVFDSVPNLTELHLKDNNISELHPRHFKHLNELERLFLLGNPLPRHMAKVYPNRMAVMTFLKVLEED